MGETTAAGARCPQCSAAVRPGAPWCTQCYARADRPGETAVPPQPFLAGVREQRPTLVLPVVGDVVALPPVRRVALAVCVVLAFLVLSALLALLLA